MDDGYGVDSRGIFISLLGVSGGSSGGGEGALADGTGVGGIFLLDYIYNNLTMLDLYEFVKRLIKYVVLGIVIAIVAFSIPKKTLNVEEITFIALSAAASFAILDVFAPSIGNAARQGAGFGIGAGIVGGLPIR